MVTWHPGSVEPRTINLRFRTTVSTMAHIPSTDIYWCYILLLVINTCNIYNWWTKNTAILYLWTTIYHRHTYRTQNMHTHFNISCESSLQAILVNNGLVHICQNMILITQAKTEFLPTFFFRSARLLRSDNHYNKKKMTVNTISWKYPVPEMVYIFFTILLNFNCEILQYDLILYACTHGTGCIQCLGLNAIKTKYFTCMVILHQHLCTLRIMILNKPETLNYIYRHAHVQLNTVNLFVMLKSMSTDSQSRNP